MNVGGILGDIVWTSTVPWLISVLANIRSMSTVIRRDPPRSSGWHDQYRKIKVTTGDESAATLIVIELI
jgi:hypothetical protein